MPHTTSPVNRIIILVNRIILTTLSLTLWLSASASLGQTQQPNAPRDLPPGQTLERDITGAEAHRYHVNLNKDEFFQVRVDQKGADVSLTLSDAGGTALATMNTPNGKQGPETLSFVAGKPGGFSLEVSGLDAKAEKGSYSIRRETTRTATAKDKRRVEVERLFVEGMTTRDKKGQQEIALNKFEEAVKGWEELQDIYLTDLTAVNLFLLANQLPQAIQNEAKKLLEEGKPESLLESRKQSFKALELYRRFHHQLDGKVFTDLLVKYKIEKISFKLTAEMGEINALSNISSTYHRAGDFNESIKFNKLAIVDIKELRSNKEICSGEEFTVLKPVLDIQEASLVSSVGTTLATSLDKPTEALDYLNQSLVLFREIRKIDADEKHKEFAKFNEVLILQAMGVSYNKLGNTSEALKFFEQALMLIQTITNQKSYEISILLNIATAHFSTFNYEKSLFILNQALKIAEQIGNEALQAECLNYIKVIYYDLGDEKALKEYSKQENSLLLSPKYLESMLTNIQTSQSSAPSLVDSQLQGTYKSLSEYYEKHFDSLRLSRVGNNYKLLEEFENALKYYERALSIAREIKQPQLESLILSQTADLYTKKKQWDKAIEYSQKSLAFERSRAVKSDLALSLRDVGYAYLEAGKPREALPYLNESLAIWHSLEGGKGKTVYRLYATVLSHLSRAYDALGKRSLAIMFGKLAVNATQRERSQLRGFDRGLQASYLKKNEKPYQRLADWLIAEGRLLEAEQVLEMLKQEEIFDYVRRDVSEADKLQLRSDLSDAERDALKRYSEIADQLTTLGAEYGQLSELGAKRTAAQDERYGEVAKKIRDANYIFQAFLKQLAEEFAGRSKTTEELNETFSLQKKLKSWGSDVVFLYTLVGDDRYRVILVTPNTQTDGKYEIKAADLNKKIEAFRQVVKNRHLDPRPLGKELYDILIRPIEKQLDGAKAKTLLWSLDGSLRLLPLAALWDGKQYFGQRYQNVTITQTSRDNLNDAVAPNWRALALGVSEAKKVKGLGGETEELSFESLPAVKTELRSIVQSAQSPDGVLPGQSLLDAEFNQPALETQLARGYKVVHIASHFKLRPGNATKSFLLLGDGQVLTVEALRSNPGLDFSGVELLTLSACETAVGEKDGSGKEIEGFGYVAQQKGAKAILATLWSVADKSTQLLMSEFYRLRKERPRLTKAAALQLAQQRMIEGKLRPLAPEAARSRLPATGEGFAYDPKKPYAHPYYWSPFILIGNWR